MMGAICHGRNSCHVNRISSETSNGEYPAPLDVNAKLKVCHEAEFTAVSRYQLNPLNSAQPFSARGN